MLCHASACNPCGSSAFAPRDHALSAATTLRRLGAQTRWATSATIPAHGAQQGWVSVVLNALIAAHRPLSQAVYTCVLLYACVWRASTQLHSNAQRQGSHLFTLPVWPTRLQVRGDNIISVDSHQGPLARCRKDADKVVAPQGRWQNGTTSPGMDRFSQCVNEGDPR